MNDLKHVDSAIIRWHPDACKKTLTQLEKSEEEDAIMFRKIRDLNIKLDKNFNVVGKVNVLDEELELYKRTLARKYLLEAHMNDELEKQKRWEDQEAFLKVEGRKVYGFRIYYMDDSFEIRFDISTGPAFYKSIYISATLKYNEDETECISECYECSWRKTKFRRLPNEAKLIIEKVKKNIDYVYNLFHEEKKLYA